MSRPSSPKRNLLNTSDEPPYELPSKRPGRELSLRTIEGSSVLSAPSSRGSVPRTSSPPRDLLGKLEHAQPSIRCVQPGTLGVPQPPLVLKLRQSLDLANLPQSAIPSGIKTQMRKDFPDTVLEIPDVAFGDPDEQEVRGCLHLVVDTVEEAKACCNKRKDENAFVNAVRNLLQVAGLSSHRGQLQVNSVQTQAIDPKYVPQIFRTPLQKKADLALAFEPDDPAQRQIIHTAGSRGFAVSHMADAYTKTTPIALGFEIKPDGGNAIEAIAQLSIWTTAQLRHALDLSQLDADPSEFPPALGFVVIGSEWALYMTYAQTKDEYTMVGPLIRLRVSAIHDTYILIRLLARIKRWLESEYFPWFLSRFRQMLFGESLE